ncbi:MAG: hypothetical protein OXI90_09995 [Gammaproteobacteria bacterium]|nr:hypothetical protein [Gammaproteobacteria bacterium]
MPSNSVVAHRVTREQNTSGDPKAASQGFDRIDPALAEHFDPEEQRDSALAFFGEYGFLVLDTCLSPAEVAHLNEFYDRTQMARPDAWGISGERKGFHENAASCSRNRCWTIPNSTPTPSTRDRFR